MKILVVLLTALLVSACQTVPSSDYIVLQPVPPPPPPIPREDGEPQIEAQIPPEPTIRLFSDRQYFILDQDMYWIVGQTDTAIMVPAGFVSDGASVPKILWPFGLTPYGRHGRAAVVHDYLYWSQVCSRKQADNIMLIAMKESGVSKLTQFILSAGVKLFGNPAWNENKRDRDNNMPRLLNYDGWNGPSIRHPEMVPEGTRQFPIDFSWNEYERFLVNQGAQEPPLPVAQPIYCRHGDTAEIPRENAG